MFIAFWTISAYVEFLCSEANSLLITTRVAAKRKWLQLISQSLEEEMARGTQHLHDEWITLRQVPALRSQVHKGDSVVRGIDTSL